MTTGGLSDWQVYVDGKCKCVYCGLEGTTIDKWHQLQVDHLIPQHAGGSDDKLNRVVTCIRCHKLKGKFDPSGGRMKSPVDAAHRSELIEKTKEYIYGKIPDDEATFQQMMKEIQAENSN
jgi:5-methylcytosine-specific restriction endonuclease McrA